MPSFFSKIRDKFSSPSPSRKANKSQNDLSYLANIYQVKEKELSKLHLAAWTGNKDKVIELCRPDKINGADKEGRAPMHLAVANEHIEVVKHLISEGAKLNIFDSEGRNPLILACITGNVSMLDLLLKNTTLKSLVNKPDKQGLNPLIYAVRDNKIEILEELLKFKDLDIDFQDKDKNSAIHYAVIQRNSQLVDILVENGIDIDKQNADGRTSLMLAALNGSEQIVDQLLDFGPNKTLTDNQGDSAEKLALTNGHPNCASMIGENRPVKQNATQMYKQKRYNSDDITANSMAEANKKFENLFAVNNNMEKSIKNDVSSKYRMSKDQDAESNTSKVLSYEKVDTWGNSDDDEDTDDQYENEDGLSNLRNIVRESDNKFDDIFGKADLTNSKELDSNIEFNFNEDKVFESNNWLFDTKNEHSNSPSSEFQVLTSFFPKSKPKINQNNDDTTAAKYFNWTIYVYTSRIPEAGTDAPVYMQIFGNKGNTTQFFLNENNNLKKPFETGNCDRFDRNLAEIGKPNKIKIGLDIKGAISGWHLEKVVLHDNLNDDKFVFHCNRWLAKNGQNNQTEIELSVDANRKSVSISSWNSDEDDSLGSNFKPPSIKPGNILKQIDEEKFNESLQAKEIQRPPEISDLDSSEDEQFQPKQFNSTKKSDQISFNLTNVTQVQNGENNTSALSHLVKNNLPKQVSVASNGSQNETIANLAANFSPKKQTKTQKDQNEDFNSSIKFLLDNNLIPEPLKKADSFEDLVEEFEQGLKPKEPTKISNELTREEKNIPQTMGLKELIREEKNIPQTFGLKELIREEKNKPQTMGLNDLIKEENVPQTFGLKELIREEKNRSKTMEPNELIKEEKNIPQTMGLKELIREEKNIPQTMGLKELIREEKNIPQTFGLKELIREEKNKPQTMGLNDLIKEENVPQTFGLKELIREEKNIPQTFGLKELIREEKKNADLFDSDNSFSDYQHNQSPKKVTPGLKDLIRVERKSQNSDIFDEFSSPRLRPDPKSETLEDLQQKFNNVMDSQNKSPIKALIEASIPPPGFRNEESSKPVYSDHETIRKVSFEDSEEIDEEIEKLASPRKPGVINQGIGAFIGSYRETPSPKKPSFYDIVPEMLNDKEETLEKLKKSVKNLQSTKLELENQLNESEDQKKKFETGFNNLNRQLAEKEKLISQMNAERLKNSIGITPDLNREIEKLKEEKQQLEKQLSEKRSFWSSEDFDRVNQSETLEIKVKALENQIEELNKDRKILADYKEDLCQKLDEQEIEIKNHQEALQLSTLHFNVEKKALNEEIFKCKKELNDLNELKRNLELLVENLKKEIAEKKFNYEKLHIEKLNYEEQTKKLGEDYTKIKDLYDNELTKLRDEKYKLIEKLAVAEAKLINIEKDAQYTSCQIDERHKQVDDLKEQLVKSKADATIQLNLLQREKEEKDTLLKKISEMESVLQKNLQEISELKLRNLNQQQELNEKSENINIKIENENKKLQNDVNSLSDKLFKTETELEKLKMSQRIEQSYDEFDFPDANDSANKNCKKINFNEKIHNELQKIRQDFNTMLTKYSTLETSNYELNESVNSLKNMSGANRNEMVLRRDPVDVSAMITEVPLKTLTTLNTYLLQNLVQPKDELSDNGLSSKSANNFGQMNKNDQSQFFSNYSSKYFNCPKCCKVSDSFNSFGSSSYSDLLKYELSKRIELQVAKELSLSAGFHLNKSKTSSEPVDSLYSTMKTNTRYSTNFYSNSNNLDLLTSLRSKFLI